MRGAGRMRCWTAERCHASWTMPTLGGVFRNSEYFGFSREKISFPSSMYAFASCSAALSSRATAVS